MEGLWTIKMLRARINVWLLNTLAFQGEAKWSCRGLAGWGDWVLAPVQSIWAPLLPFSKRLGCHAPCHEYYLQQVTLAEGWICPTRGLDLLSFIPYESPNNNNKNKPRDPWEPFLHLRKCFQLVLSPLFSGPFTGQPSWFWILQQEIKGSQLGILLAETAF